MEGGNANHPRKGSMIKVEPITDTHDIAKIRGMLKNPMHLGLFTVGVNTGLRASDLVGLTVGQVKGLKGMDVLVLRERKTGKVRSINFNGAAVRAVQGLVKGMGDEERLFPLTVPSVHRLVKSWCRKVGLKGNYGSHTLRKTWGLQQRVRFGVGLPELMKCFGHSSQEMTMRYLCIQPEEVKNVYANEI